MSKNTITIQLQITALKQVHNMVEVHLQPYNPVSKEELERARAEVELELPQPSTVEEEAAVKKILGSVSTDRDEAMMQKFIGIYRKEMPELFEVLKNPPFKSGGGKIMTAHLEPLPVSQDLYLPADQYRELGSPPLFSILNLTLCISD